MNDCDKFPNQLVHHLFHDEQTHSRPIEVVETQNPVTSSLQGHGDMDSNEARATPMTRMVRLELVRPVTRMMRVGARRRRKKEKEVETRERKN